jgi:hypothetical protein
MAPPPIPPPLSPRLGARCLDLDRAVVAVGDGFLALPPPDGASGHPYGPAVGVRCAPAVDAIAYPVDARIVSCEPSIRRLAVVVARAGEAVIVDPRRADPLCITAEFGPLVDVGRRALGLATPAEPTPPVTMLDAVWADRLLAATLDADLGAPPSWSSLGALHPLAGASITSEDLRLRRLAMPLDWSAFRRQAARSGASWPGLTPGLAEWLDDGSFARWALADLPPATHLLDDLAALLAPETMVHIDAALVGAVRW